MLNTNLTEQLPPDTPVQIANAIGAIAGMLQADPQVQAALQLLGLPDLADNNYANAAIAAIDAIAVCRECGCSTIQGCPGGCHWVEPDLCSNTERHELIVKMGLLSHDRDEAKRLPEE